MSNEFLDKVRKQADPATAFKWDRNYLFQVLTTGRDPLLKDQTLIAAFRKLDRKDFVPYKHQEKAYLDLDLDIGYGETFTRLTTQAQMAELMKPKLGGKYLDLGTGTGFFAMVLGFAAGDNGVVFSIERVQWLWELARSNASKYPDIKNVKFLYRDGSEGLNEQAPFDGIHISFALDEISQKLKMQLSMQNGILVAPTTSHDIRVITRHGNDEFVEEVIPGFIFEEGKTGKA